MNSSGERIQQVIHGAVTGMTSEELEWRPEGKWSAAEILEHLALTYSGTSTGLHRCVQGGKTLARTPTLKDRLTTFVVVTMGYLPSGREAPAGTRPQGIAAVKILSHVDRQLAAMQEALRHCEERFGTRVKLMNHPILGPLTGPEWRKFHLIHARHHAKQIERLRLKLTQRK